MRVEKPRDVRGIVLPVRIQRDDDFESSFPRLREQQAQAMALPAVFRYPDHHRARVLRDPRRVASVEPSSATMTAGRKASAPRTTAPTVPSAL